MGGCDNVVSTKVNGDMLEKYPELKEKGFEEGDKIDIATPYDGKVEGPMKKAGACVDSCKMTTPVIDANNGELWESSFVNDYFPKELGKLENEKIDSCYKDPVVKYSAGIMMQYSDDLTEEQDDAVMKFAKGQSDINDLKLLKPVIASTIEKAAADGVEVKPLKVLYQDVSQRISNSVVSKK